MNLIANDQRTDTVRLDGAAGRPLSLTASSAHFTGNVVPEAFRVDADEMTVSFAAQGNHGFRVVDGPCQVTDNGLCVVSERFVGDSTPENRNRDYTTHSNCDIATPPGKPLRVRVFDVQRQDGYIGDRFDRLVVNGKRYTGASLSYLNANPTPSRYHTGHDWN